MIWKYIYDPAWENRAYVHIKFDHCVRLWSSITLCLNTIYQWTFVTSTAHNGEFNASYTNGIACTEGGISVTM